MTIAEVYRMIHFFKKDESEWHMTNYKSMKDLSCVCVIENNTEDENERWDKSDWKNEFLLSDSNSNFSANSVLFHINNTIIS